jgi:hypothetical protein
MIQLFICLGTQLIGHWLLAAAAEATTTITTKQKTYDYDDDNNNNDDDNNNNDDDDDDETTCSVTCSEHVCGSHNILNLYSIRVRLQSRLEHWMY